MGRKRDSIPPERLSPTQTVAHITDDFIEQLNIPGLPVQLPRRLEEAIKRRVAAYLYHLQQATQNRYIGAFELRLVRDAHKAVLTAHELNLRDSETDYASFRRLAEALGYERCEVGYRKKIWG